MLVLFKRTRKLRVEIRFGRCFFARLCAYLRSQHDCRSPIRSVLHGNFRAFRFRALFGSVVKIAYFCVRLGELELAVSDDSQCENA